MPRVGKPKTNDHLVAYDERDIAAVLGARTKMKIAGKEIGEMTPCELSYGALSTRSHRRRMACVAELLSRLAAHDVCPMLNSLQVEVKERK